MKSLKMAVLLEEWFKWQSSYLARMRLSSTPVTQKKKKKLS
jgi:hypothetical protein